MNKFLKTAGLLALIMLMGAGMSVPAMAAKKKINSVTLRIEGKIEVEERMGSEQLEIYSTNSHVDFDSYTVENLGFKWALDDTPELKIYLNAEEGYIFNITKASQLNIIGGTYKSATRESSSTVLVVTVTLPSLANQVSEIDSADIDSAGNCKWSAALGAGMYEIKFIRGNNVIGGVQTTSDLNINCRNYMEKEGNYSFKVRALNKNNSSVASQWRTSNTVYISKSEADEVARMNAENQSAGAWMQDSTGYWFRLPDGSYPYSAWRFINNEWYYFNEQGYMETGWLFYNNYWYYLDAVNGNMWKNARTPDGYFVGIDGTLASN